jgi:N-acetylmuramate 1-kinase
VGLEPIVRGGSDRFFYRVSSTALPPCILIHYGTEKEENAYYAEIAQFLRALTIPVPRVLAEDSGRRLLWMEDLGVEDLHAWKDRAWSERRPGYESVLRAARVLHRDGLAFLKNQSMRLMPGFDPELYQWEQDYFANEFVEGVCGCVLPVEVKAELAELNRLLCALPLALVHRDFQSQNIMMVKGEAVLIDFQGLRTGAVAYDLGSLLYDPYVEFTREQRLELLRYYFQQGGFPESEWPQFQKEFHAAAAQRLMQALGAYGFLGKKKGRTTFLEHIPAGLRNLQEAATAWGKLPRLLRVLQEVSGKFC